MPHDENRPAGHQPTEEALRRSSAFLVDEALGFAFPAALRAEADFAELLDRAGLRLSRVLPTGTVLSVVEAVAAD
ncbi:hypothetical protein [Kitasatospora sp. NPDC096204]|uniref:hypothetical protein n=1 Tax=Kitasatospora sp. NPDC096204 TaxID=3364094 RepID=UPI0037F5DC08